jgi:hypothetical protein
VAALVAAAAVVAVAALVAGAARAEHPVRGLVEVVGAVVPTHYHQIKASSPAGLFLPTCRLIQFPVSLFLRRDLMTDFI